MDVELDTITRVEYLPSDDHLLNALRRYKRLRTYPTASDRAQQALHQAMLRLQAKGLARHVGHDGSAMSWRSAV